MQPYVQVIEYIQFLKEKVEKSEPGYPVVWNHESMKMMPWVMTDLIYLNFLQNVLMPKI